MFKIHFRFENFVRVERKKEIKKEKNNS